MENDLVRVFFSNDSGSVDDASGKAVKPISSLGSNIF